MVCSLCKVCCGSGCGCGCSSPSFGSHPSLLCVAIAVAAIAVAVAMVAASRGELWCSAGLVMSPVATVRGD